MSRLTLEEHQRIREERGVTPFLRRVPVRQQPQPQAKSSWVVVLGAIAAILLVIVGVIALMSWSGFELNPRGWQFRSPWLP